MSAASTPAFAPRIDDLAAGHEPARRLLAKSAIRLEASGDVSISYRRALRWMQHPSLLTEIQAAYVRTLPGEAQPEFTVRQDGPGRYSYVNRKGHRSSIEEVFRGAAADETYCVLLHVEGDRWFGRFQSLILIQIKPAIDDASSVYAVEIAAYPENAAVRGLARLSPVRRYFGNKTREMIAISTGVVAVMD